MNTPKDEVSRRKQAIENRETDITRWADQKQLEAAWNGRAQFAAQWIPCGARVLDIGCGAMALEKYLPAGCSYQPCDVVARDERTIVCDLNHSKVPSYAAQAERITLLGVIEYLFDPISLFTQLLHYGKPVIVSYCATDWSQQLDRRALGWVNDFSLVQLTNLITQVGWQIKRLEKVDAIQALFLLEPQAITIREKKRVLVLSYNNYGNFGDRLGFHLLNSVLPAETEVTYTHCNPWNPPTTEFDLIILGIGNSLFDQPLTKELLQLLDRIPKRVGIFGTQYRHGFIPARLHAVIDRLDHWFARYEEDILLYGRDRKNISHLGDWLIHAFPMAVGHNDNQLNIGDEALKNLPLDRTIQQIQQYKKVFSDRLHPLLCALTSAEQVAYQDKYYGEPAMPTGKFRSMFIDIFGRTFAEKTFWPVDRNAVVRYKIQVAKNITQLTHTINALLYPASNDL